MVDSEAVENDSILFGLDEFIDDEPEKKESKNNKKRRRMAEERRSRNPIIPEGDLPDPDPVGRLENGDQPALMQGLKRKLEEIESEPARKKQRSSKRNVKKWVSVSGYVKEFNRHTGNGILRADQGDDVKIARKDIVSTDPVKILIVNDRVKFDTDGLIAQKVTKEDGSDMNLMEELEAKKKFVTNRDARYAGTMVEWDQENNWGFIEFKKKPAKIDKKVKFYRDQYYSAKGVAPIIIGLKVECGVEVADEGLLAHRITFEKDTPVDLEMMHGCTQVSDVQRTAQLMYFDGTLHALTEEVDQEINGFKVKEYATKSEEGWFAVDIWNQDLRTLAGPHPLSALNEQEITFNVGVNVLGVFAKNMKLAAPLPDIEMED